MRYGLGVALACLFASAGAISAQGHAKPGISDLLGTWAVYSIVCDNCKTRSTPDREQDIQIGKHTYHDPFNLSCAAGAAYVLQGIREKDVQNGLGVPRSAYGLPKSGITLARLECPVSAGKSAPIPIQSAVILLFGHDNAVYLGDDGVNFLMHRR